MKKLFTFGVIAALFPSIASAVLVDPATVPIAGVSVSGEVQTIAAPADASMGVFESNTTTFLWAEGTTTIANPQFVTIIPFKNISPEVAGSTNGQGEGSAFYDSGVASVEGMWGGDLAAGTYNSYFFHTDKDVQNQLFTGSMTFAQEIVGIIYKQTELGLTDPIFGAPGTTYGAGGSGRIFELDGPDNWLSLSADRKTLEFKTVVQHNMDDMRILTAAVPVPAAVWLFGSGLLGLVGIARRRKTA